MKVIVVPVNLEIGGSAINALDLAAGMRDRGHTVSVYARPGPLLDRLRAHRLRFHEARYRARPKPSPGAAWELYRLVRKEQPDLVHAYEDYAMVESLYGIALAHGIKVVGTLYSMGVEEFLPSSMSIIAGTKELQRELRRTRADELVPLLDPPIDTVADVDHGEGADFRAAHRIARHTPLVVLVSRLSITLKLDALRDAIDSVDILAAGRDLRLLIVGEGEAFDALLDRATKVNARHGREVVTLVGAMSDPRPAYSAADVALGMGTSVLRSMAMERPSIVVGEQAFSEPINPATIDQFFIRGFWGVGAGGSGARRLSQQIDELLQADEVERAQLGRFGRQVVQERFSLDAASSDLERIYREVAQHAPSRGQVVRDGRCTFYRVIKHKMSQRLPGPGTSLYPSRRSQEEAIRVTRQSEEERP